MAGLKYFTDEEEELIREAIRIVRFYRSEEMTYDSRKELEALYKKMGGDNE